MMEISAMVGKAASAAASVPGPATATTPGPTTGQQDPTGDQRRFEEVLGRPSLEAASLLEEQALRLSPASELAQGFLGLALRLAGHTGRSQSVLEDLAAKATNPCAGAMARALLADHV